ncbi:MAG: hypothetical protein AAF333_09665 [Planctomycetota bacterium]
MNDQTQTSNLPVHREVMGSIAAAVWMNHTEAGDPFYVTTLSRTYRDPDSGEWKDSSSFGQRDLLAVAHVAQRAAQKISELTRADRQARSESDTVNGEADEPADTTNGPARPVQHTR